MGAITGGCDFRHSQYGHDRHSILQEHDVAVQNRCIGADPHSARNANVGADLLLVAHVGSREVHAPLPDDERARTFGHDSRNARK